MPGARPEQLILRADAGARIGAGHVMRCLALAQEWLSQGGRACFVTDRESPGLRQRLTDEGCQVVTVGRSHPHPSDWPALAEVLADHQDAWVALDGYHFDPGYQKRIRDRGHRLLVIDDMAHLAHYHADLLVNQNLHAGRLHYSCEPGTRLLLGTRYALLRNEFLRRGDWRREIPAVGGKILVTLGGGDQENVTRKVVEALTLLDDAGLEAVVVVGACNPHLADLQAAAARAAAAISFVHDATDMAQLMIWADLAVAAAGSSCWELCYLGVPALLLVLAENQRPVAEALTMAGAMLSLGWHDSAQPAAIAGALRELVPAAATRRRLSERGRLLVPGDGRKAVVGRMRMGTLALRDVRADDCRLLWHWVNDADVRRSAFRPGAVSWDDHVVWFSARRNDPDCVQWIGVGGGEEGDVGQIRFELQGNEAVADVSIDAAHRGKGYGAHLIELGVRRLSEATRRPLLVHAYVKPDNPASLRAFGKAGFVSVGETRTGDGVPCIHLVRRLDR